MEQAVWVAEMAGIVAFALSGALAAINKHLDIFGVLVCGITTAMGGGIFRDILIANLPPVMFQDYEYLICAAATALLTFIIAKIFKNKFALSVPTIDRINNIADAVGLGLFTVIGMNTAIRFGYADNMFFVVFLGAVTGCGGGMARDIILREIPFIFTKRIYAVASLAGAIVYYVCYVVLDLRMLISGSIALGLIFLLRVLASVFRWDLPKAY